MCIRDRDILVPPDKKSKFKPKAGQVVMVDIIEQPSRYSQPIGRICQVLGNYADPGMEIEIALRTVSYTHLDVYKRQVLVTISLQ